MTKRVIYHGPKLKKRKNNKRSTKTNQGRKKNNKCCVASRPMVSPGDKAHIPLWAISIISARLIPLANIKRPAKRVVSKRPPFRKPIRTRSLMK